MPEQLDKAGGRGIRVELDVALPPLDRLEDRDLQLAQVLITPAAACRAVHEAHAGDRARRSAGDGDYLDLGHLR